MVKVQRMILGGALMMSILLAGAMLAQAQCPDGTTGDDVLVCSSNPGGDVEGDLGNDSITVNTGVQAGDIEGDGAVPVNPGDDNGGGGNGGDDVIVNQGDVDLIFGDYVGGDGGDDTITNDGDAVLIVGDFAGGADGNDTITNNGTVGNIYGDDNFGNDGGDDTITNTGTAGIIYGNEGNDTISNDGTADSLEGDSGDDQILNAGTVNMGINAGTGDDTVTIELGSTVVNTIDGGADTDTLTFRVQTQVDYDALVAALAGQLPAAGSITVGGQTYTWVNFEELRAILVNVVVPAVRSTLLQASFTDGRINHFDTGAPVAIYCTEGNVLVLDIDGNSQGTLAFMADAVTIRAAAIGTLIAQGLGDSLSRSSDTTLTVNAPTLDGSKTYTFNFTTDCQPLGPGSES
jgi:hypothetical protein